MVLAGYTVVGEFHYLHHGPGGVPYADANEMGHRHAPRRRAGGHPDHAARHVLPPRRHRRAAERRPAAVLRRHSGRVGRAGVRIRVPGDPHRTARTRCAPALGWATGTCGAAIHSVRAVDPESIGDVAAWADGSGAVLHAHVSEQPARERRVPGCATAARRSRCWRASRRWTARFTAVHATHLTDRDIELLGLGRLDVLHLRHDRARARRRDRADGRPRCGRRRAVHRVGLARGDRPVRGDAGRSSSTSDWRRCGAAPISPPSCSPPARATATRASAGTVARSHRVSSPTSSPSSFDSATPRRIGPLRPGGGRRVRRGPGRRAPRRRRRRARRARRGPPASRRRRRARPLDRAAWQASER